MDEWDKKEKHRVPIAKYTFKKGQLKEVMADCYGFRVLVRILNSPNAINSLLNLQTICEKAHENFDIPTCKEDRRQIEEFILQELKKIGWHL